MCGIVGVVANTTVDQSALMSMCNLLHHRGPDDHGLWCQNNVGLAHQRLSVIDTSAAGAQPLISADQRWIISYNGEIYNCKELREQLPGVAWRGHSDTEVLAEAIATWGVADTLARLNGIFAFAAYDQSQHKLYLARDQVGVKPLYYGVVQGQFYFASEMHPLQGLSGLTLDAAAVTSFLRYRYVPTPDTIYAEINKLPPGSYVCLDAATPQQLPVVQPYWQLRDFVTSTTDRISVADAADELEQRLRSAIRSQLVSDVPIGAFLSGGIDSSLVCAIANQESDQPLQTFSIGFADPELDEAPYARTVAEHLGTRHTELYVSDTDLLDTVDKLPALCDEPFADSSILPTYLVSRLAREHVTVVLSGDGGDELFWGYTRYATTQRIWRRLRAWPLPLRRGAAALARQPWLQALTNPVHGIGLGGRRGSLGQKLAAAGEFMHSATSADLYHELVSHWRNPNDILLHPDIRQSVYADPEHWTRSLALWPAMASQDFLAYLPDDVLTKVDRASMCVSLEARVPLLDRRIVEFAATLPGTMKAWGGESGESGGSGESGEQKILLKTLLARHLPPAHFQRPKAGFGVPLGSWLRGPLRPWAEALLNHASLDELFDRDVVQRFWQNHLDDKADNAAKLWDVLMLQNWRANL